MSKGDESRANETVRKGYRDCQRCGALLQSVSSDPLQCQVCGEVHGEGPNLYFGNANEISFA